MRKEIHWEVCKKLKSDNTTNWYMHKLESVQENATHKILCNFEIQTDHEKKKGGGNTCTLPKNFLKSCGI